ncbi:adhesive plaque matrix protein-like, partial [Procambarus clarkii]|uniref:adhesive plaque matrix protein-like n=1 Tax=Procambarus clarkii TaxID=6728 RepID=UPI0037437762
FRHPENVIIPFSSVHQVLFVLVAGVAVGAADGVRHRPNGSPSLNTHHPHFHITPTYTRKPVYTPTYTPTYTPKPVYTPNYDPKPVYTPTYAPKPVHTPTYAPKPVYTPTYTPKPSYKPRPAYVATYTPKPAYLSSYTPEPIYTQTIPPGPVYKPAQVYNDGPTEYDFGYGVADNYHGTNFGHSEKREGYRTEGQYFVDLPDGRRMVVKYYSDETGYHPTITCENTQPYPQHKPVYKPEPVYKPIPIYKPAAVYKQEPVYKSKPSYKPAAHYQPLYSIRY